MTGITHCDEQRVTILHKYAANMHTSPLFERFENAQNVHAKGQPTEPRPSNPPLPRPSARHESIPDGSFVRISGLPRHATV